MKKLMIILVSALATTALAGVSFEPIRGVNTGLPAKELAWHELNGSSEEEHSFMIAFFEGGVHVFTTFFTFKYGPFHKWGFYTLLQQEGRKDAIFVKGECPESTLNVSRKDYGFTCGETKYSGVWPDFLLSVRDEQLKADIKFHSLVQPFTPGKTLFSPDGKTFSECMIYAPRAKTEGSLTYDRKTVKLLGEGYADHTYQNFPFTRQGAVYYAVRAFPDSKTAPESQLYLNFSQQEIHKGYGGGNDAFFFAADNSKILGASRKLAVEPLEEVTDPETGYKYVKKVSLKVDDPSITFSGVFYVTKTIEIMDIFKWVPPYARKIAATFFKRPVYFRFLGNVEGQLKVAGKAYPIRQQATSEMNFTQ